MKQSSPVSSTISLRIALLRYLLIVGIVLLHSPPYASLAELPDHPSAFEWTKAFFQGVLFRMSVPILSCISGYLLFSARNQNYLDLLAKKGKTILVPMLAWNGLAFAAMYLAGATGHAPSHADASAYPFDAWTAVNGLLALQGTGWNYPLNFLRDLLVMVALSPILRLVLTRAPYVGLALWVAIVFADLDGPLLMRPDIPVTFYLGALVAVRRWNLERLDSFAKPCLIALLSLCLFMLLYRVTDRKWFVVLTPFLIWPVSALLAQTAFGQACARLSPVSFFIFLFHAFPLKLISGLLAKISVLPFEVAWFLAPALTVLTCHGVFQVLSLLCPRLLGVMTGGRVPSRRPRSRFAALESPDSVPK